MSKSYVIEVGDDQAGLIIREEGEREYLFHAALNEYSALEGRRFANPLLAERAAIAHSGKPAPSPHLWPRCGGARPMSRSNSTSGQSRLEAKQVTNLPTALHVDPSAALDVGGGPRPAD